VARVTAMAKVAVSTDDGRERERESTSGAVGIGFGTRSFLPRWRHVGGRIGLTNCVDSKCRKIERGTSTCSSPAAAGAGSERPEVRWAPGVFD
jgi:hypothetical protein